LFSEKRYLSCLFYYLKEKTKEINKSFSIKIMERIPSDFFGILIGSECDKLYYTTVSLY
jgi:hypothetical protein